MPTRWALGYSLGAPAPANAIGIGGVGGSFAFGDPESGISFALTKNLLRQDFDASTTLIRIVLESLT